MDAELLTRWAKLEPSRCWNLSDTHPNIPGGIWQLPQCLEKYVYADSRPSIYADSSEFLTIYEVQRALKARGWRWVLRTRGDMYEATVTSNPDEPINWRDAYANHTTPGAALLAAYVEALETVVG
jgi:hypothetical protein